MCLRYSLFCSVELGFEAIFNFSVDTTPENGVFDFVVYSGGDTALKGDVPTEF